MEQVINNLLTNAIKYTPPGGAICISVKPIDGTAELRVRDNGIGMAPELLPRVFDLFTQSDRALDRSQGGLGIGLTLVRSLIEMHDGHVIAKSDGAGTQSSGVHHHAPAPRRRLPRPRTAGFAEAGKRSSPTAKGPPRSWRSKINPTPAARYSASSKSGATR